MRKRSYLKPEEQDFEADLAEFFIKMYKEIGLNTHSFKIPAQPLIVIFHYYKEVHKLNFEALCKGLRNLHCWNAGKAPNLWAFSSESYTNELLFGIKKSSKVDEENAINKKEGVIKHLMQWLQTWCVQRNNQKLPITVNIAMAHAYADGKTNLIKHETLEKFKTKTKEYIDKNYSSIKIKK